LDIWKLLDDFHDSLLKKETTMHPELTQFESWLTCQYPHSSLRKHYRSDLVLFFSWAEKPPSAISFYDVDHYIHHCLAKQVPLFVR
jgi:hypothetical protein